MPEADDERIRRVLDRLATEPLRLRNDNLVERPWGGRRLVAFKGLEGAAVAGRIGESFEVSAFPDDPESLHHPSIVEFDDGSTMRLAELLGRAGEAVLGPRFFATHGPRLPLLPKLLDVEQLLSVQSHPPGNPELYVILACEPGASLRIGFAQDVDPVATAALLADARADQDALAELYTGAPAELSAACAALLGAPDGPARLVDRLGPGLRDPSADTRARALELVTRLDLRYRETLALLNRIAIEPGMVLFNADPPGATSSVPQSAQVHCLGNPEGKAALILEIRRPGVTYRAWDHVRFPVRELAISEAFAAMSVKASRPEDFVVRPQPVADRPGVLRSVSGPAFTVDHLRPTPGLAVTATTAGLPTTLHAIAGSARLRGPEGRDWGLVRAGESLLIPAGVASLTIEGLTPNAELVQVLIPLDDHRDHRDRAHGPDQARHLNLAQMRQIVRESRGPREVLAIVNPGDSERVGAQLRSRVRAVFRADGATSIVCHEESTRRGQLLGLLDAHRAHVATLGDLDPESTAVGIMLPGKGTRLSPITQALAGIKPNFPVPIRAGEGSEQAWLDAATASLWTWTQVARTLERQGFRGIAWKWGDEPQIAARTLASFDYDLADVDAIRFGAPATITEDLARNKEWLLVDPATGDLVMQVRRRERAALLERMGLTDTPEARAHVHIGSPAFSHRFLAHAEALFGDLEGWLDVDGYLFEALTQDPETWAAELARDPALRALIERFPDFYARARSLRERIEAERGHPLRIVVVDFGAEPYWADVGQLDRARAVWARLRDRDEAGAFARALAGFGEHSPDAWGNYVVGEARIPDDGSVRDSVIIDAVIDRAYVRGAVIVGGKIGIAGLEPGAVAIDCHVAALRMGVDSLAFGSVGDYLRIPAHHAHTSIAVDPSAGSPVHESWFADMREDSGAAGNYDQPRWGNPGSFAAKLAQVRGGS